MNIDPDREDTQQYCVCVNDEGQYSIWGEYWHGGFSHIPLGWREVGKRGQKDDVLEYIKEVWTDMRPKSLRKKMDEEFSLEYECKMVDGRWLKWDWEEDEPKPRPENDEDRDFGIGAYLDDIEDWKEEHRKKMVVQRAKEEAEAEEKAAEEEKKKQEEMTKDADLYLGDIGMPLGMPRVDVKFGETAIDGIESNFEKTRHLFLQKAPDCTWEHDGEATVVMVDPDAPDRNGEGIKPGKFGPWLHWIVTDCKDGSSGKGNTAFKYSGPAPPYGNHRYILILFKQTGKVKVSDKENPEAWDFPAFLKNNEKTLEPIAMNFFYTKA